MTVSRTDRDGVAELVLDRADRRNAFDVALLARLREHLCTLGDCRAVLLTGAGEAFCAGADLHETARERRFELIAEVLLALGELRQPTVAAVHGPAIGGGWGLALACDVCFASRSARFCLPELAKGFRLPDPLTRRLVQVVGPVRAAGLTYTGTMWSAEEALAGGAVARVLDSREELLAAARELCGALAAVPPASMATAKLNWTEGVPT
jgi:2-(1,2-epoxy-1,2-dihydrophenyl)acetyl-CoA isomerase